MTHRNAMLNILASAIQVASPDRFIPLTERYRTAATVLDHLEAFNPAIPSFKDVPHTYLSTGCLHGRHEHCQAVTGLSGTPKLPGTCKFCTSPCICGCHEKADTDTEAQLEWAVRFDDYIGDRPMIMLCKSREEALRELRRSTPEGNAQVVYRFRSDWTPSEEPT